MFGKRKPPQKPVAATQAPTIPLKRAGVPAPDSQIPMAPAATATDTQASMAPRDGQEAPASGSEGRKLVVGREICLTGEIKACEKLVVEGRVEADLTDSQFLEITEHGLFKGNAVVKNCQISGVFEGELVVHSYLQLESNGRINGSVYYGEIKVERGGRISGSMEQIEAKAPATADNPGLVQSQAAKASIPRRVTPLHPGDEGPGETDSPDLAESGTG